MIDFKNGSVIKLKKTDNKIYQPLVTPLLVNGENIIATYKALRDGVVFTNKRILSVNVQGITGTKKDITSLPYSKIQVFSVETSGVLDLDSELELWFSGLGKVRFEFVSDCDITSICRIISEYVL